MSGFFRPEAMAFLSRWSEVAFGVAVMVFGWWITRFGGWIWLGIGGGVIALGLGWAVLAWRRLGFQADPAAPGLVELDEGRIRYLHPRAAGEISLADLVEIRLLEFRGQKMWRLDDLSGQRLLVPVDAAGAGALFDAFSLLPGLSSADLAAAISAPAEPAPEGNVLPITAGRPNERRVWRRAGQGLAAHSGP